MPTVIFETETAIFQFNLHDVTEILAHQSSEDQTEEPKKIMKILESSEKGIQKTCIKTGYFDYLAFDFLGKNKGSAFCKSCHKTYQANQLQSFPLGFGESPFTINSGKKGRCLKRIFGPKIKGMGMFGGKEFQCPNGHELISMIAWISY
jgi:hypothetical protein